MCKCLQETQKKVWDNFVKTQKEKGVIVKDKGGLTPNGYTCQGLMFSTGSWQFILPMEFKYAFDNKNGREVKRTYKTHMIPTFCPICGKKINYKSK